jgi:hypothetical protein
MNRLVVKAARRAIRLRMRAWYMVAVAFGNGVEADRCKHWLDGDGLYPPEPVAEGKYGPAAFGQLQKIATRQEDMATRYSLVSDYPYPCEGCGTGSRQRYLFVCNECGEITCLDCECECYRSEDL